MQQIQPLNNILHRTLVNMPSITTASQQITDFPFRYIAPFKDDPVVPLYSSVPLFSPQSGCLPCAACGNFANRKKIIAQQAQRFKDYIPNEISGNDPRVGFN